MKYGHFSKDGGEYIVTRFDTPRPWINVVGNDVYGVYVSQNGFGFSFYRDWESVKLNYIDIVGYVPANPQSGKFVYLRDEESGRAWANVPLHSARGYASFRCVHGQGYTTIAARRHGIETHFEIVRPFRGATYRVTVRNPEHVQRGVKSLKLDGKPVAGQKLPVLAAGTEHRVDVVMGSC